MTRLRSFDRWVRRVTLLALTLATLAPGVSHALRHLQGDTLPWSQVCSAAAGVSGGQLPDDPGPVPTQHAFEHCAACALHLQAASLPPAARATVARGDLTHAVPTLLLQAPRTQHGWASAQPRAPP
ncbi:MAG TPA: DUF2946 domain-containing protein, partial [Burkholderiaceae bacterium]|nr:DUF2946 domain-containing protein [Burkholderiaceae bacterium]